MKKKLLAILLSASMVVCLMPTMAFAAEPTEESTPEVENVVEESKEEVQEETPSVTEETKEEEPAVTEEVVEEVREEVTEENATLSETLAESVEEAELQGGGETGSWEGYKFKATTSDFRAYVLDPENGVQNTYDTVNGVIDLTEKVNEVFKNASTCIVTIRYAAGNNDKISNAFFNKIETSITVDKASEKDTTFNYELDSFINLEQKTDSEYYIRSKDYYVTSSDEYDENEGYWYRRKASVELVKDNVVLKAGETSVKDYLVLRTDEAEVGYIEKLNNAIATIGFVIGEKSNDGNYEVPETLWAAVSNRYMTPNDVEGEFLYATFANDAELNSFIASINALSKYSEKRALFKEKFSDESILSFSHTTLPVAAEETTVKSTKKGVQTGDSNELGLWLAMGMLASVAAAGYALKRREN